MGVKSEFGVNDFLGPRDDVEIDSVQEGMLNAALRDDSAAVNVAVMGPLGSGKSSLVRAFAKRHSEHAFAYVSLADFETANSREDEKLSLPDIERKVVHQVATIPVDDEKLKWSSTSFPSEKQRRNARALSFMTAAYLAIAAIFLACFATLGGSGIVTPCVVWAMLRILLAGLAGIVVWAAVTGFPPVLKSISAGGAKAELSASSIEGSFFDENLMMVFEVFGKRKENIFVFEDLDRLKHDEILTHLRELSLLLSSRFPYRHFKFVYCLADSTIQGEGRTKFFDVIVPVIPYSDAYNAYGRLVERLGDFASELKPQLIRNIALYLPDYRLLKSAVNDYRVYYDSLKAADREEVNRDKLFAIMVIKDAFPSLFAGLQGRCGAFYNLVSKPVNGEPEQHTTSERISEAIRNAKQGEKEELTAATDLIVYLLDHGYLDRGYYFYLAYPDPNSLNEEDRAWLMQARNETRNFCRPLHSVQDVVTYLDDIDFGDEHMLNLDLLRWSLENPERQGKFNDITQCMISKAPELVPEAVNRVASFPARALEVYPDFFLQVEGIDRKRFLLSIAEKFSDDSEKINKIDQDNDRILSSTMQDSVGALTEEDLSDFNDSHDICPRIVATRQTLDVRIDNLSPLASSALLEMIAASHGYIMSESNCRAICDVFCDPGHTRQDVLERMRVSRSDLIWDGAVSAADEFVDDYVGDGSGTRICCDEDAFLELVNCNMRSRDLRRKLIGAYDGHITDIGSVADNNVWNAVLAIKGLEKSYSNAFKAMGVVHASDAWIRFINSFDEFSPTYAVGAMQSKDSDEYVVSDADIQNVENLALNRDGLNDDKYEALLRLVPHGSLAEVPTSVSDSKKRAALLSYKVALNLATLTEARTLLDEDGLCSYEVEFIDDFISVERQTRRGTDAEMVRLLCTFSDDSGSKANVTSIVGFLRSQVDSLTDLSDVAVLALMSAGRISGVADKSLMQRFGRLQQLDDLIVRHLLQMNAQGLVKSAPSVTALCAAMPKANLNQQVMIIEYACRQLPGGLRAILGAIGDPDIDSILGGRRPRRDSLDPRSGQIADTLCRMGMISIGENGQIYVQQSKWK